MDNTTIKLLLLSRKGELSQRLIDQGASDYAAFRYQQGIIHGIALCLEEIKRLEAEHNKEEDFDES